MDLSVITVTWKSAEFISAQIMSVRAGCRNISCEQIIVDNASTDGTVELLEKTFGAVVIASPAEAGRSNPTDEGLKSFDSKNNGITSVAPLLRNDTIKLIKNAFNTGFAYPNNQGAKIARGDFLLFLNPDTRVAEGSLDKIVEWMRGRPEVGLASCKLVDENGDLNEDAKPRRWPGVLDQLAIILKIPHLWPRVLNKYLYKDFDADKEQEVDSVRGSFMLMRREVYVKLGRAFDPRYFIWFEDVDICREVKRLGCKVVYTPLISCVDYVGQSFKKRATLWKQKQFTESMLRYFQKWEPWWKWIWIAAARPVGIMLAWMNDFLFKIKNQKSKIKNTI